jgi:DNA topoisomerase IA
MQSTPESYNTTSQEKQGKKKKKKQIKKLRSLSEEIINACDLQTISS